MHYSNLENINIAVRNINSFLEHAASSPAEITFDKGNQTQGITHKVYMSDRATTFEVFRAKTLPEILSMLIGFDYGLRKFRLFRQR